MKNAMKKKGLLNVGEVIGMGIGEYYKVKSEDFITKPRALPWADGLLPFLLRFSTQATKVDSGRYRVIADNHLTTILSSDGFRLVVAAIAALGQCFELALYELLAQG